MNTVYAFAPELGWVALLLSIVVTGISVFALTRVCHIGKAIEMNEDGAPKIDGALDEGIYQIVFCNELENLVVLRLKDSGNNVLCHFPFGIPKTIQTTPFVEYIYQTRTYSAGYLWQTVQIKVSRIGV